MEIINNLFIGSSETARDFKFIKDNNIKCIVNCTKNIPNHFKGIEYMRVNIDGDGDELDTYLPHVISFIYKNYYLDKRPVLIHSRDGNQRAAIILACYIMKCTTCRDSKEALETVYVKYPTAFNEGKNIKFFNIFNSYIKNEKINQEHVENSTSVLQ
jgi:hypothetical protein